MNRTILGAALAALLAGAAASSVHTQSASALFFSEYVEGTSNNKALEIYNPTGAAVNLANDGYNVQMFFNGNPAAGLTINLSGTVAAGDVFVLAQASAGPDVLARADQTNANSWYNGDDAVVLRRGTVVIDVIGQVGTDPGTEWGAGLTSTADNTLRRAASICAGDPVGSDAFDPAVQWEGFATDTFGDLGSHTASCATTDDAPTVSSTVPANGATDFPIGANLAVTFSEPVDVAAGAFTLACATSGTVTFAVSGGPTTFTLDPAVDLAAGESCTLTVLAASVTDRDSNDPPDNMVVNFTAGFVAADPCTAPYTPIFRIQGSGATAAVTGAVTTQGIVIGDYEGPGSNFIRGFFIQDPTGDGNAATSDGIFVFNGNNDSVSLGQLVRVSGSAAEFQGQTQIGTVTSISVCGSGAVPLTEVSLPFANADAPESYEGMLVRLPQTLYVTEHFQLGRFGEVLLSSGGRLSQPTNVTTPGAAALALQAANGLNQILIDDGQNNQNADPIVFGRGGQPLSAANTLRGGDTATGIVGVFTYSWGGNNASPNGWRVRPVNALGGSVNFEATNPRSAAAPEVGGTLKVAGMNLLNYFNTFDGLPDVADNCRNGVGGAASDCRGADDAAEFDRQWRKTTAAILATGADVIGVVEVENDGYGADSALADLVDRLNALTAPDTYAYVDVDAETGQQNALGTDAIKVGLIYKPASVVPVGRTAALNTVSFVTGGDAEPRNRPSLAQAFQTVTGGRFVAVINHLKSKGSACDAPDAGDGQGNCNDVRTVAARELATWLAADPTGTGEAGVLLLGDFNAYAKEDPIAVLESAGFANQVERFGGASAYSYVFDGQWGNLDHALASAALAGQIAGVAEYHANADEPSVLDYNTNFKSAGQVTSLYAPDQFRAADHDPVVVGLDLLANLNGHVTGGGWMIAEPGDFPAEPALAGKVSFELAARYEPGATVPTGRVSVELGRAGFAFVSSTVEWLTLSGQQAVMQGQGAVGGVEGYGFRLSPFDGRLTNGPDQLRLRIWNTTTAAVVFDNGAVEPIGRGSIVVHTGGTR